MIDRLQHINLSYQREGMAENESILVVSVDRDNDLGEKTGIKGPVFGREACLKAASSLGLADPEDSDSNAIFQAVRVFDEIKKKNRSEVAVITGHKNVGVDSDMAVLQQLDKVLKKFNANYVVLVSDGSEDEHVMPIIQNRVPILSVKKVIVKQSEQLESGYYKIKDFINESLDNPKIARLVFGLPAIILVLLGIFGIEGFRVVIGLLGAYLLIKGFKLEHYFISVWDELKTSVSRKRIVFFFYIISIVLAVLASYRGMTFYMGWEQFGIFEMIAGFVSGSIYIYFVAGASLWTGRNLSYRKRSLRRVVSVIIFGFAIAMVIFSAAEVILSPEVTMNFILSIIVGFALIFIALYIEIKS